MKLSQKEKVLIGFLGIIFIAQIVLYTVGVGYCMYNQGLKTCPEIAKRGEVMFGSMTATVLALITNIGINK